MRYTIKQCLYVGLLCLALPGASFAASLTDTLDNLSDLSRSADDARAAYDRAKSSGGDYSSHERQWHERENRLENARVERLAKESGVSKSKIRSMRRDGESWENIARRNGQDPSRLGYGSSRYDHDRDGWKGTPPGLAKKGGMPPGQAKKMDKSRGYDDGHYRGTRDNDGRYHDRDRDRDGQYRDRDRQGNRDGDWDQKSRHRNGNADSDRKYHRNN